MFWLCDTSTTQNSYARPDDYTIGWVSALPTELAAVREMLDETYQDSPRLASDTNIYLSDRTRDHNVVRTGLSALVVMDAGDKLERKDIIRMLLPIEKFTPSGNKRTELLSSPLQKLLAYLNMVGEIEFRGQGGLTNHMFIESIPKTLRTKTGHDVLFEVLHGPRVGHMCDQCSTGGEEVQKQHENRKEVAARYGRIASENRVIQHEDIKEKVNVDLEDVSSFEMETPGLAISFPCHSIHAGWAYSNALKCKCPHPNCGAGDEDDVNLQHSSSAQGNVMAASDYTYSTTLSDKESVFSMQSDTVPAPSTELSHDDHCSLNMTFHHEWSKSSIETPPAYVHKSDLVKFQEMTQETGSTGDLRIRQDNRYGFGHDELASPSMSQNTFHAGEVYFADAQVPDHNDFTTDPAHEYWAWSNKDKNWWHKEEETNTIVWAPIDFD